MSVDKEFVGELRTHLRQLMRELDVVKGVYFGSGFTFGQCHVLFEISQHRSIGLTQLAENLLVDKSNVSRTLKRLVQLGMVKSRKDKNDSRQKHFSLTAEGNRALKKVIGLSENQVHDALLNLDAGDRSTVMKGMSLYAEALRKSRLQRDFVIRPIQKKDNVAIAGVIRNVLTEFGAVGEGYSYVDPEIDEMYQNYQGDRAVYLVIVKDHEVLGGGGIGPLAGGSDRTCELKKMFFVPEIRGCGMGRRLLKRLLEQARKMGYRQGYLETLLRMDVANRLYQNCGFSQLAKPLGKTGHSACDRFYAIEL